MFRSIPFLFFLLSTVLLLRPVAASWSAESAPRGANPRHLFMRLESQIGGEVKSIVAEGDALFVSREDGTTRYDISMPTLPGEMALIPDFVAHAAAGPYLYGRREGTASWEIWRVEPSGALTLAGTFTPQGTFRAATDHYLFFGGGPTVFIYSLTHPLEPALVSTWEVEEEYGVAWIEATNSRLAVSFSRSSCGQGVCNTNYLPLKVLDISDPATPVLIREHPDVARLTSRAISRNTIYLVEPGDPQIYIRSLDPATGWDPTQQYPLGGFFPSEVTAYENTLYVAGQDAATGERQTRIFDITVPTILDEVATYPRYIAGTVENGRLINHPNYPYIYPFVALYDVQMPHAPVLAAEITHATGHQLIPAGDTLYMLSQVADGGYRQESAYLHRVDDRTSATPRYLGAERLPFPYPFGQFEIVGGEYLYATNQRRLDIYRLPAGETPVTFVRSVALPECEPHFCRMYASSNVIIVEGEQVNNSSMLSIYSTADPTLPIHAATVNTRFRDGVAVDGNQLVYADDPSTNDPAYIHIVDLSDPAEPVEVGQVPARVWDGLTAANGYIFYNSLQQLGKIKVIDARVPANPVEVATLTPPYVPAPQRLAVEGDRLFIGNAGHLAVFDVSDPVESRLLGYFPNDPHLLDIVTAAVAGDQIYVVGLRQGFQSLRLVESVDNFLPLLQRDDE